VCVRSLVERGVIQCVPYLVKFVMGVCVSLPHTGLSPGRCSKICVCVVSLVERGLVDVSYLVSYTAHVCQCVIVCATHLLNSVCQ